jgi:hypothetical protein
MRCGVMSRRDMVEHHEGRGEGDPPSQVFQACGHCLDPLPLLFRRGAGLCRKTFRCTSSGQLFLSRTPPPINSTPAASSAIWIFSNVATCMRGMPVPASARCTERQPHPGRFGQLLHRPAEQPASGPALWTREHRQTRLGGGSRPLAAVRNTHHDQLRLVREKYKDVVQKSGIGSDARVGFFRTA